MASEMILMLIPIMLYLVKWTDGKSCPEEYLRYSQQHSFCLPPNKNCQLKKSGINGQKDVDIILKTHNELRNKVAVGSEKDSNQEALPTAADMMQMTWDSELASIAQQWANNCDYKHDCGNCRAVENFQVGQNIGQVTYNCPGGTCSAETLEHGADWKSMIEGWYSEVKNFEKKDIKNFPSTSTSKGTIGHFTQVIWAKSWRVGCGFSAYVKGNKLEQFLVCNYGPGGNLYGGEIYTEGPTCSRCPINSCCGDQCPGGNEFKGLCKMNVIEGPKYPPPKGALFYCDFSNLSGDCSLSYTGAPPVIRTSVGGSIFISQLKNGQQIAVSFNNAFKPNSKFCLQFLYRKCPNIAGQQDLSDLQLQLNYKDGLPSSANLGTQIGYTQLGVTLTKPAELTFALNFTVPSGAQDHFMYIKQITAFPGDC